MSTAPATPGPGKTSQPTTRPRLDEDGRRERLEAFHATLSAQVLSLTTSQAWTAWLGTAARFHHYSTLNTVAIWAQRSDATQVAGYRVWQSMGRQVRKGEQGIQILAPVTRRPDQPDPDGPDGRDKDHDSARPSGPSGSGWSGRRVTGARIWMPCSPLRTCRPMDCQTRYPATWVASERCAQIATVLRVE